MMAKKIMILFLLASLSGHALVIALTTRIDIAGKPRPDNVIKVELKTPAEVKAAPAPPRRKPSARTIRNSENSSGFREDSVAMQNPGGPYEKYLLQIRQKIENLWSYPPRALADKKEGNAVVFFTIEADGSLNSYYVTASSGSAVLDEGALACVRAASPFAPLPVAFNLSRLHVTATFSYRLQ